MVGLLGIKPSRNFKIFRSEFPAIFRFNGKLFMEHYDINTGEDRWEEISEEYAHRWVAAKVLQDGRDVRWENVYGFVTKTMKLTKPEEVWYYSVTISLPVGVNAFSVTQNMPVDVYESDGFAKIMAALLADFDERISNG